MIVTTFIAEDKKTTHRLLNPPQKWEAKITMENSEAGKLYFYYVEPEDLKNSNRANFKRILFLHRSNYLILFGEGPWKDNDEEFKRC